MCGARATVPRSAVRRAGGWHSRLISTRDLIRDRKPSGLGLREHKVTRRYRGAAKADGADRRGQCSPPMHPRTGRSRRPFGLVTDAGGIARRQKSEQYALETHAALRGADVARNALATPSSVMDRLSAAPRGSSSRRPVFHARRSRSGFIVGAAMTQVARRFLPAGQSKEFFPYGCHTVDRPKSLRSHHPRSIRSRSISLLSARYSSPISSRSPAGIHVRQSVSAS